MVAIQKYHLAFQQQINRTQLSNLPFFRCPRAKKFQLPLTNSSALGRHWRNSSLTPNIDSCLPYKGLKTSKFHLLELPLWTDGQTDTWLCHVWTMNMWCICIACIPYPSYITVMLYMWTYGHFWCANNKCSGNVTSLLITCQKPR